MYNRISCPLIAKATKISNQNRTFQLSKSATKTAPFSLQNQQLKPQKLATKAAPSFLLQNLQQNRPPQLSFFNLHFLHFFSLTVRLSLLSFFFPLSRLLLSSFFPLFFCFSFILPHN
ncbi:Uncharacterized protein TCM_003585 [Theobroma cacao]|uniref:Transmembrane protein n=1 Tax=Theobroma cacao TaxID=3641 RepID=A0A061DP69_THECC|nr:Uncharacterized protein TCM_003585 [Theobroma cacao]